MKKERLPQKFNVIHISNHTGLRIYQTLIDEIIFQFVYHCGYKNATLKISDWSLFDGYTITDKDNNVELFKVEDVMNPPELYVNIPYSYRLFKPC